jgi:hypothetical protein
MLYQYKNFQKVELAEEIALTLNLRPGNGMF